MHPGTFPPPEWQRPSPRGCTREALGSRCRADVGRELCKSTAGCPGVYTSPACPTSSPGLPASPGAPRIARSPPGSLGNQDGAGSGAGEGGRFGMVGG